MLIQRMSLLLYSALLVFCLTSSCRGEGSQEYEVPYSTLHIQIPYADYYVLLRILAASYPQLKEIHRQNSQKGRFSKGNF
jgi:hypothetical protein